MHTGLASISHPSALARRSLYADHSATERLGVHPLPPTRDLKGGERRREFERAAPLSWAAVQGSEQAPELISAGTVLPGESRAICPTARMLPWVPGRRHRDL